MLIEQGTDLGITTVIKNSKGARVQLVKSFDTVTKKAVMYAALAETHPDHIGTCVRALTDLQGNHVLVETILYDCKDYNSLTGEEII